MRTKIGVIGGGQLAWMMAKVAPLEDVNILVQTPSPSDSAVNLATKVIFAPIDDYIATAELAKHSDIITFENEFVNLDELQKLADEGVCFYPRLSSLSPLLDKYEQRCFLRNNNFPVPHFREYNSMSDFDTFSFPLVLKARRHGYDGQGTIIIHSKEELTEILPKFKDIPLLIEEFIPFERELAIVAARSVKGEIKIYPVVETYQHHQVCRWVIAPALLKADKIKEIESMAEKLLIALDYVGVLAMELFLKKNGEILVNETAPRTHNSGHYTIDACDTSQFALQLQAITGKPFGNIDLKTSGALMINLLGYESANFDYLAKRQAIEKLGTFVHWYGKSESRIGRKLGHVTVLLTEKTYQTAKLIIEKIESIWYGN